MSTNNFILIIFFCQYQLKLSLRYKIVKWFATSALPRSRSPIYSITHNGSVLLRLRVAIPLPLPLTLIADEFCCRPLPRQTNSFFGATIYLITYISQFALPAIANPYALCSVYQIVVIRTLITIILLKMFLCFHFFSSQSLTIGNFNE